MHPPSPPPDRHHHTLEPRGPESLSQREREVVSLAVLGRPNKLIAYELGIAAPTVRVLMTRAAKKLGVQSRVTLIEKYRQLTSSLTIAYFGPS